MRHLPELYVPIFSIAEVLDDTIGSDNRIKSGERNMVLFLSLAASET